MTALTLYTIGHSNHTLDRFVGLLRRHHVERLVDVRSHPYSRWAPQFRKRALAEGLLGAGMSYVFLGDVLGGRPAGDEYNGPDGKVDYALRSQALDFIDGLETLLVLGSERPTAVMCAEEDPERCHRRALIAPALRARDVQVAHIRGDGRLQVESEGQALDGQLGLFT